MYTGDFLFARAIYLLSELEEPVFHQKMSAAIVRICEGEIEQIRDFYNWNQSIRTYLRRIERKTAVLIALSCELGALAGGAPAGVSERLRRFGYYTGMAFQIIDDLLDFEGDAAAVGKPVAGDLLQGNLTLPALFVHSTERGQKLEELVRSSATADEQQEAVQMVRNSDGIEMARRIADRFLTKALEQLAYIPNPERHAELQAVAAFVNQRAY